MSELGGDEIARRLLAPVLDWSSDRIGALVGGCVFFSPRQEPVASAWGSAGPDVAEADAPLAGDLQELLFPPSRSSQVARGLDADPAQLPVFELDPAELGSAAGPLGQLLASRGLAAPLLVVLRATGRVAGLIWLCRGAGARPDQRESVGALRHLQPLLELMPVTAELESRARFAAPDDLADRGLTPREVAVAGLALGGASNAAIAARLGISERTVKNHMTRILAKCGVRSRTQLIALYRPVAGA